MGCLRFLPLLLFLVWGVSASAFELVVVDSPGQPSDELAHTIWRLTRHRRSRCGFRWIRLGSRSESPSEASPPPSEPPPAPTTEVLPGPAIEPEWDATGEIAAPWKLEGLPRILLLNSKNHVLLREVFLPISSLRYLSRHPEGFSQSPSTSRMGIVPPNQGQAGARKPR
jgi:hypothetical protein